MGRSRGVRSVRRRRRVVAAVALAFSIGSVGDAYAQSRAGSNSGPAASIVDAYGRLSAANAAHDGDAAISAAREMVRLSRGRDDDEAWFALMRAAETFEREGYDDDAIVAVHRVLALSHLSATFDEAFVVRALTLGSRVLERRGRSIEALEYAERAVALANGFRTTVPLQVFVTITRVAYAHGDRDTARSAFWHVIDASPPDLDRRLEVVDIALRADDTAVVRDAVDRIEQGRSLEADQYLEAARVRLSLARVLAEQNEPGRVEEQIEAIRGLERRSHLLLLEPAAVIVAEPDLAQFDRALVSTLAPLRCDAEGRLVSSAIGSLQARLAMISGLRARLDLLRVPVVSFRARLREAAVYEAAAASMERGAEQCLADHDAHRGRELLAQAEALDREANRVERHDPHRADGLRIEAMLLRERASSSRPSGADAQAIATRRDEQLERSRAAIAEAERIAGSLTGSARVLADPDASRDMALFIARAVGSSRHF